MFNQLLAMLAKFKVYIFIGLFIIAGAGVGLLIVNGQKADNTTKPEVSELLPTIQLNIAPGALEESKTTKRLSVSIKSSRYSEIKKVEYYIDDQLAVSSRQAPFEVQLSLSNLQPGKHQLQARAYDAKDRLTKSEVFEFEIAADGAVMPADKPSQAIARQGVAIARLTAIISSPSAQTTTGGGNAGGNSQDNQDQGQDPPTSPTTWPAEPPAEICGNNAILGGGPTSAPAGAVVVPAGDNSNVNFTLADTTYWFAGGTHYLGDDQYSQIMPGNNAVFVGAPGAIIDGQDINRYAFTQHATNVTIRYLTFQNFVAPRDEGVINHDSGTGWTMEYITAQDNGGGAVFLGSDNTLRYSCLKNNGQYGFQVYSSTGPENVLLDHNEVSGNNTDDWEAQVPGCGCTGGGKFWDADGVTVTNNYVHNNHSVALWADTNDNDFVFEGNYVADNDAQGIFYEISYNMTVRYNNFLRNGLVAGPENPSFPTGAIYLSEAGGDNRVPAHTANIEIHDNKFEDNWAGVILWENADRYCASPANTSSGYCTIVNPSATLTSCGDPADGGSVDQEPYLSDCRWKTQNVKVYDNIFDIDKASIDDCLTSISCGTNGIFANEGSYPSWSPYMGSVIQDDITLNQNNLFSNNTYLGDWQYAIKAQSTVRNFAIWQDDPYFQDTGSTYNGQSQYLVPNAFDTNSSGFESTVGSWVNWYNATLSRSTTEAHSGSASLRILAGDQFWAAEQEESDAFAITTAHKRFSFWHKLGSGDLDIRVDLQWLDDGYNSLQIDNYTITPANSWQKFSQDVSVPDGATLVKVRLASSTSSNGEVIYFDDFVLEDLP